MEEKVSVPDDSLAQSSEPTPAAEAITTIFRDLPSEPPSFPSPGQAELWAYVNAAGNEITWVDSLSGTYRTMSAPGTRHQLAGSWVYYQENPEGRAYGAIRRINAEGREDRLNFTAFPDSLMEGWLRDIQWAVSSDGERIAWERRREAGNISEMYLGYAGTGEFRLLRRDSQAAYIYTLLDFLPGETYSLLIREETSAYYEMDGQSGERTLLFEDHAYADGAQKSAFLIASDGPRLLYFSPTYKELGQGLYELEKANIVTINLHNHQEETLANIPKHHFRILDLVPSPDDQTLLAILWLQSFDPSPKLTAWIRINPYTGEQWPLSFILNDYATFAGFGKEGEILLANPGWPSIEKHGTYCLKPEGTLQKLSDLRLLGTVGDEFNDNLRVPPWTPPT